jgi:glycogen debranching enzyme
MSDIIEIQGQYYIRANSSLADATVRVLKHADTFALLDRHGDIRPLGFEVQGLFHEGTRFLSRLKLEIDGQSPLLLSSNVKEENDFFVADLTNPDLPREDGGTILRGTIHLVRTIFLWQGSYFERIGVFSFARHPVAIELALGYQADFVDLFEIRGISRKQRGRVLPPDVHQDQVVLQYEGLDSVARRAECHFTPPARDTSGERAVFPLRLEPQGSAHVDVQVRCRNGNEDRRNGAFETAFGQVRAAYERYRASTVHVEAANQQFNAWLNQARADIHMLLTRTPHGLYPFAGIPWFSCVFGRDGLITALETLWMDPNIARGVLAFLADAQATESSPVRDAEPGKILHEKRGGEMAALGEIPFGCYYGAIDSTPLFVVLAGRYLERTADRELISRLWPNIQRALEWIDRYGDTDGDGFVEYCQRAQGGLSNQGWKDSEDAVFHADGTLAVAPIALCEVQGYVFEAKQQAARIAAALGEHALSRELAASAEALQRQFHKAFWCEDIRCYALALDGSKNPCRVRSSNAGQCLFSGIASREHAARIKDDLMSDAFFSGWGIRTIPEGEARYNPMSYHNGSIWPHDNALIAAGLARYGFRHAAIRVFQALLDASQFMDLNRLPELYCGFRRRPGEGPTLYPVACNPQAWSSAAVFFTLQACLGMSITAARREVSFKNPVLPAAVESLEIDNLQVGLGTVDLSLRRHPRDVAVTVKRRTGRPNVVVTH